MEITNGNSTINGYNEVSPGVFYKSDSAPREVGSSELGLLNLKCDDSIKKRARICLHDSPEAKVNIMIISLSTESVVHKHFHRNGSETYIILSGRLLINTYNDIVKTGIYLDSDSRESTVIFQVPIGMVHDVKAISDHALYAEITEGPFDPSNTIFIS